MLPEDLLAYIFGYCASIEDATKLLLSLSLKPNGIYCHLLQRTFLKAPNILHSYYKIKSYIPRLDARHAYLYDRVICDKRFYRRRKILFKSPAMRLHGAKRRKNMFQLKIQDPTRFFHFRLKAFINKFVDSNKKYVLKHFKNNFQMDNITVEIKAVGGTLNTHNICDNSFMFVCFHIKYDVINHCFFPFLTQYCFQ